MASFNASVSEDNQSKVLLEDVNRTRNQTGQCTPMQSPALGSLKLVAGNGTSVGTVMTLLCPYKHRAVSGGRLSCVQYSNITLWSGGVPECKPLARYEDEGFRMAVLASVISAAIIIIMSIIFITLCLLKCVRKEERGRMERERKRQDALWKHMDQQEMRDIFYSHKGRNTNNNNSKPQQHTHHNVQPPTSLELQAVYRCHQKDCPLGIQTSKCPLKPMPPTSYIQTQTSSVLQPPSLPYKEYDPALELLLWKQSRPTCVVTQDSAVLNVSRQGLKDPFRKGQHPVEPKNIWVISV